MKYIKALLWVGLLLALDQWTKYLAALHLKGQAAIPIIKNVFELSYTENRGAAFSIMEGQRSFFVVTTTIFVVVLIIVYTRIPDTRHYLPMKVMAVFFCAGALGNFVDRLFNGYVVDFFYFKLINFAIFNVADIYITCTGVVFVLFMLFYYKNDDDFEFLKFKRGAKNERD